MTVFTQVTGGARRHPAMAHLSDHDLDDIASRLNRLRSEVMGSLGEKDARYIRRLIRIQRLLDLSGRLVIYAGILHWSGFVLGAMLLGLAKILENMEIGHNVLHGQWDWLRDPDIHSTSWEWDSVCPSSQWQRSHNFLHHKWTNVIGMDRDYGYMLLRFSDKQPWHPMYLLQPLTNLMMALSFQWGLVLYDDEMAELRRQEGGSERARRKLRHAVTKVSRQVSKDYVLFPLLAGPFFLPVFLANMAANVIRNVWAYAVIFCGHFPEGVEEFSPEEVVGESEGHWYVRQIIGSANIEGGWLMHLLTGNLSHQIEHHLFPTLPSNRYAQVAPDIQALCREYGIRYNSRALLPQFASVWAKVFRYALPSGRQAVTA